MGGTTLHIEEASGPVQIGAGSFASVSILSGGPVAYKEVHNTDDAATLRAEYDLLRSIYPSCGGDSVFAITRALGFNNPH